MISRLTKATGNLGLAVLSIVMSLLAVEIMLRIYANMAETGLAERLLADPFAVKVEPHGVAGFRPRPGTTFEYGNATVAHTNAMGFRGPTVRVPKLPGTFRVILLGGSSSFGWGVNDDETIDAHMRQLLAERYGDRVHEVVNLAFDGYDSYQLYERLKSDGLVLEPDAIIVNSGVNDVSHAWYRDIRDADPRTLLYRATLEQLRHEQTRGGPTIWSRTKHWSYTARLPGWIRQQLQEAATSVGSTHQVPPTPHWDFLDYFERNLQRIAELGTQRDSVVLLFSTPPSSLTTLFEHQHPPTRHYWIRDAETTQILRDSLSARMRRVVAEEAEKGVAIAYVPHDVLPPSHFLDDAHLTPEGNRLVAADFVDALEPWLATQRRP